MSVTAADLAVFELLAMPAATPDDVLHAKYRSIAARLHPDRNQGDPKAKERFQMLQQSYRMLQESRASAASEREAEIQHSIVVNEAERAEWGVLRMCLQLLRGTSQQFAAVFAVPKRTFRHRPASHQTAEAAAAASAVAATKWSAAHVISQLRILWQRDATALVCMILIVCGAVLTSG
jgi:hypothetical protein